MWILVYINVMLTLPAGNDQPYIQDWWYFNSMEECFAGRDKVLAELGAYEGQPLRGTQLVCINNEKIQDEQRRYRRILGYRF